MFLGAAGHDAPRSEVELLEEERGCLTNLVIHLQGLHCFLLRLNLAGVQSVHHQLSLLRFEHKYVPCVNN